MQPASPLVAAMLGVVLAWAPGGKAETSRREVRTGVGLRTPYSDAPPAAWPAAPSRPRQVLKYLQNCVELFRESQGKRAAAAAAAALAAAPPAAAAPAPLPAAGTSAAPASAEAEEEAAEEAAAAAAEAAEEAAGIVAELMERQEMLAELRTECGDEPVVASDLVPRPDLDSSHTISP